MTDNLKKRRPQDARRINVHEEWEVNWWRDKLNVSRARLEAAVGAVGTSARAVKRHLGKMTR